MATHKNTSHVSVKRRKKRSIDPSSNHTMSANDYTVFSAGGTAVRRFRTPHTHDVLFGRGGGVNSHAGNVRFRNWVAERKSAYTLAEGKTSKANIAREVIDMVLSQDPPGRFLQRDPSGSFWFEVGQDKVNAKTAQALREGAPRIRASHEHHEQVVQHPIKRAPFSSQIRNNTPVQSSATIATASRERNIGYVEPEDSLLPAGSRDRAMAELHANLQAATADAYDEPKQVPFDYDATPPLKPVSEPANDVPSLGSLMQSSPEPLVMRSGLKRVHSLAFSDTSAGDETLDFVNPFEDEAENNVGLPEQVPLLRRTSISSDFGGYGALLTSYDTPNQMSQTVNSSSDSLSDLPDAFPHHVQESDFAEGVMTIYDALHSHDEEDSEALSSPISQYRRLSAGGSALTARLLGRAAQ